MWPVQSHVAEDGVLHVVAEPAGVAAMLASLDLAQAKILRSLACFWDFRVQYVTSLSLCCSLSMKVSGKQSSSSVWALSPFSLAFQYVIPPSLAHLPHVSGPSAFTQNVALSGSGRHL